MAKIVQKGTRIQTTDQSSSNGLGFSITGGIFIAIALLCLFYAYSMIKVFFNLKDNLDSSSEGSGLDGITNLLGAIFVFSGAGVQSLVIGIGVGILGVILLILGTTFWSIGLKRSYS